MINRDHDIISAFIAQKQRDKYRRRIIGEKRGRFLDRLNHMQELDQRWVTWTESNADIFSLLKNLGAPDDCYLLSASPDLDGREMRLEKALEEIPMIGWGTILCAIPGRLGYYYDECGERRAILHKKC